MVPFFARLFGYLAAFFLTATMMVTVADVFLRTFFSYPMRGVLELVELGLACTIFLALPAVFLRDEHLVVDVVDHLLKPAAVRVLDLLGAIVSLVKLTKVADVYMGWGFYAVGAYVLLLAAAVSAFDAKSLWHRIEELLREVTFIIMARPRVAAAE